MVNESMFQLKSDPALLDAVREASKHKISAEELFEQSVSFAYSAVSSDKFGMTKEQVRHMIIEQQGGIVRK